MKLHRTVQGQPANSIIALVDVVFFLLAFFMLIGRLDATAPFEVLPATAETGADLPAGGITLAVSANQAMSLDGVSIDANQVVAAITDLLAQTPEAQIRINADQDAQLRLFLPIVADLERIGARDIVLVVTPEKQ
jgi:biopolymer transport protein ExbD